MVSKTVLKVFAVWLSFNLCTAEEPTFSYPTGTDNDFMDNQYIVEFRRSKMGEESKQALFSAENKNDDDAPRVIRRIDSRNISVVKFRSHNAAEKWRESAKGVKYFERGKSMHLHNLIVVNLGNCQMEELTNNQTQPSAPYGAATRP